MFLNANRPTPGKQSIISLVPSITELLFDLGLGEEVTGITKFCVHPAHWPPQKVKVGGTKNIDVAKIKSLSPTLIIANKEENVKSQVEVLADYPIWLTDVNNLDDACVMITELGMVTGRAHKAENLVINIREAFLQLNKLPDSINAAYLIWRDPYMTVGGDTFIHDMLTRTGMRNVFADRQRYPQVSVDDIKNTGCEVLLLSSEPYPFKEKHIHELAQSLPEVTIKLVDGEMFSWYGSRLVKAAEYFRSLQAEWI